MKRRRSKWLAVLFALLLTLSGTTPVLASSSTLVYNGDTSEKTIALTFDVEGNAGGLSSVLQALAKHQVHSTFFLSGYTAAANTTVAKQILAGGHEIGNHSYSHPDFTTLSAAQMVDQLRRTENLVYKQTGQKLKPYFRPPYGSQNAAVRQAVGDAGCSHMIMWNIDPRDWEGPTAWTLQNRVFNTARNGGIVLMHINGSTNSPQALSAMIQGLKERGYRLVTISEMLGLAGRFSDVPPSCWAYDDIEYLSQQRIIRGYPDGTFRPQSNLLRQHAAKMIAIGARLNYAGKRPSYTDVSRSGEYSPYIAALTEAGAVKGYPDGSFRPLEPVTRGQTCQMLVKAFTLKQGTAKASFSDLPGDGTEQYIKILASNGIVKGYADGTFRPDAPVTRAEFAKMLVGAMRKGTYGKTSVRQRKIELCAEISRSSFSAWDCRECRSRMTAIACPRLAVIAS